MLLSSMLLSTTLLGLCLLGLLTSARGELRRCYKCLVQEGCLTLDKYEENATKECDHGVEHCVISKTESKVTGAIAIDHTCGGKVYEVEDPTLKDGCFEGVDDPGARTKRTVCYCSYDLCNSGFLTSANKVLLLVSIFLASATR